MVYSSNITTITTSGTLSTLQDVYIVNASGGSITLTLPLITGDGIHYELRRVDNSVNTVTVQGSGGQLVDNSASVLLYTYCTLTLHSLGNVWYITVNNSVNSLQTKAIFSTAFVQNNGSTFVTFSGTADQQVVCYMYYPGTNVLPVTSFSVILGKGGGTPVGNARLVNHTGGGAVISTIPYDGTLVPANAPYLLTTNTITVSNLPTGPSLLRFTVQHPTGTNKLDVYGISVK